MRLKSKIAVLVLGGALVVWGVVYAAQKLPGSGEMNTTPTPPPGTFAPHVSIIFGGDIMLDRNVALWHEANPGVIFAQVAPLFASADIRVANLEGTITTNPSIARQDSSILRFTFDPNFAQAALAPLHLDAVSLANNHALDFGEFGYDDTVSYLEEWGIKHFGQPYNDRGRLSTTIDTPLGLLCFIGYHSLYKRSTETVLAEIQKLRPACSKLVVFSHWGEEYMPVPEEETREIAHSFIDAGVDLVIGAHPHVVQPHEVYKGRAIFYSLGNFVFDQRFSPEVQEGLLVRADVSHNKACYTPIPIAIQEGVPVPMEALDAWCLPW